MGNQLSSWYNSIRAFKQWLIDNHCYDVCMESTGKYYIPIYNLLEDDIRVTVANPKWVAAVKGNKDDVKDSKWIGDLFRLGLVPGSFIPDKSIRILREYTDFFRDRHRYGAVRLLQAPVLVGRSDPWKQPVSRQEEVRSHHQSRGLS